MLWRHTPNAVRPHHITQGAARVTPNEGVRGRTTPWGITPIEEGLHTGLPHRKRKNEGRHHDRGIDYQEVLEDP